MMKSQKMHDAEKLFEYLYVRDEQYVRADLIIGFGHFDLKIPRRCAQLYQEGVAPEILFTGGSGSGSADFCDAEAAVFRSVLIDEFPQISQDDVIIESNSANTGENITMSAKVLRERDIGRNFDTGIKSVAAVASPYRQRRVWRTLQKHLPEIKVYNMPPETNFEEEVLLFKQKGEDFLVLLIGEVEHIINYPKKGFMEHEEVPPSVKNAFMRLRQMLLG